MIRQAKSEDCSILEILYRELNPHSRNIKVLGERVEQIKQDLNNFLFVYEEEGIIQGTIFITLCLDPMFQFRPFAIAENLIVDKAFRGSGVGKKLLIHVEQFCKLRECTKIMLLSNAVREDAHAFLERNGFNGTVSKGFKKYISIGKSPI